MGQVTTTILSIVMSGVIARTLGAQDFGILYLLTSIVTFGYVFVDWGHALYVTREIARHPRAAGRLIGSVLFVRAIVAILVCGAVALSTWLLGYDVRTRALAVTMVVAWLPMYLGLSYSWAFRGFERMEYDASLSVVLKVTSLVTVIAAVTLGGRLVAVICSSALAGFVTSALAIFLYRRLRCPPLEATLDTAWELILGGAPLLAISLAITVQPYIDANLLYKLAPTSVVGWYGAAWNIAGTLVAPASILAASIYPRWAKTADDNVAFRSALITGFRPLLFVAVLGAAGTYLFADVAVGIVYGNQKFGPAGAILRTFAMVLPLVYVDMLLGSAIVALRGAGRLAAAKVAAVLLTTVLELVLVPWCQARFANGGIGIILASATGELLMVIAAIMLIRDFLDLRMLVDSMRALVVGAATVLSISAFAPASPIVAIPSCISVFVALSIAFGLVNLRELLSVFAQPRAVVIETVAVGEAGRS
jgi:O-antigen/teichoic acid export membrane protein